MPETETELLPGEPTQPYAPMFTGGMVLPRELVDDELPSEPLPVPAPPIVVAGNYQYLKRWQFVLAVAAVWVFAAAAGWGLYYWWFHSIDKTPSVFVVLLFVITCTVGGLLTAMVLNRPVVTALAIGMMSAPLAAVGAAAVLHGTYFCDRVGRCLMGVLPY